MLAKDIRVGDFIDGKEIIHVSHGTRHVFFEDEDGESYEALFTIDCNAVSVSKKRLPIKGDIILVRDFSSVKWKKLIFLMFYGDTALCVTESTEDAYREGKQYSICGWTHWKWPEEKESEIEISVKINGKEAKLSDISKETLLKIRENN